MHNTIEAEFWAELAQIQAESIGWIPLEEGVYLHVSDENATEVLVVGVPQDVRVIVAGQDLVRDGDIVIAKEMTRAEAEAAQKAAQP